MTKAQKVTNANGTTPGTDGDQVKYKFSGSPTGLYEHRPEAGEVRVMTVTVECTSVGDEVIKDGVRHVSNWAVRAATLGRQTTLPDNPDQMSIDDVDDPQDDDDSKPSLTVVNDADTAATAAEQAEVDKVGDPFAVPGSGDTGE